MEYILKGKRYSYTTEQLIDYYHQIINYSDDAFIDNLPDIIHFTCFVCWLLNIPTSECLSDEGVLHQLIHLLAIPSEPLIVLEDIRQLFKTTMYTITQL